jgi:hypothetical protein
MRPVKVRISSHQGDHETKRALCDSRLWINAVDLALLNRRGWVFQERLLSKRNSSFGGKQLCWECCEMTACEAFPHATRAPLFLDRGAPALKVEFTKFLNDTTMCGSSLPACLWQRLVEYYTNCQLSDRNDKLVAFGGIASRVQKLCGCQYLAGLWRDRIAHQLCRAIAGSKRPGQPPGHEYSYIAPSWSWAASFCPVTTVLCMKLEHRWSTSKTYTYNWYQPIPLGKSKTAF